MDQRTKILASLFGAFVVCALASEVVYPRWIEPLLTMDKTTAERTQDLERLQREEAKVQDGKWEYREYVKRVGSFDVDEVINDLHERINGLLAKHGFKDTKVTPTRPSGGGGRKKAETIEAKITVTATAPLQSAVLFLKDLSELPHLIRVTNVDITPVARSGRSKKKRQPDLVKLNVPMKVSVLPRHDMVRDIPPEDLMQPESFVRHEDREYSGIWMPEPFIMPVKLDPLEVRDRVVQKGVGERVRLDASADGGDGDYEFQWDPADELDDAHARQPRVLDTQALGTREFLVTVTDGSDSAPATGIITLIITEEPVEVADGGEEDDSPVSRRWKNGKYMDIPQVLMYTAGSRRVAEVMVCDRRQNKIEYYTIGDEFDGGELVFVHQTGILVHREDGYFVYPIGTELTRDIPVDEAVEQPRLQEEAARYRKLVGDVEPTPRASTRTQADRAEGDDDGGSKRSGRRRGRKGR